jgi:hypothetical protein
MKKSLICIILISIAFPIVAQNTDINPFASVDKKAMAIPDSMTKTTTGIARYINQNFSNDVDKTRAVFIWVATNITYDYDNMFAMNFYETWEEKIVKPLRTRKGICENFAALFSDICSKSGIKSCVIEGYTKQNGFNDYIPHAWCAARIDTSWYLFDPTWGSGYVNNNKFYKKINNSYFKVAPSVMIKSHMPFDYLWQFLNYPVTNAEFAGTKSSQIKKIKPFFNYIDSIATNAKLNIIDSLKASAYRIEKNGVNNAMIFDRLQHIRQQIENEKIKIRNKAIEAENNRQTMNTDLYNASINEYNLWVSSINDFIRYRNNHFMPAISDAAIQEMLNDSKIHLDNANSKIKLIHNPDHNLSASIPSLFKLLLEAETKTREQREWLDNYLSKGKLARKQMFNKYSWFGIPLN